MLRLILLIFGSSALFTCKDDQAGQAGAATDAQDTLRRPNIIFLLTDDQRFDAMSFAGNPVIETPNMDRLAQNGVYFKNAYVTTSICAMSRASIITGQYARRHDIWDFGESFTEEQYANSYPALFKKAGYTTGFIGKFGVGNIQQPTIDKYFDFWGGFNGQGSYNTTYDGAPVHLTKKMGNQALDFLDQQQERNEPFMLSISFKAPHVEGDPGYFLPDQEFSDLYQSDMIDKPEAAKDDYFDYFPSDFITNENGATNVARKRWRDRFDTPEKYQDNVKKYYQLIHGVDVVIGRISEKLQELDLDQNTIVVFSSDNGFYLGEYGFAGKWYGSDPSIRVPMIIYDPRPTAPKGQIIEQMALNIDIAPTMLAMAGIPIPDSMQGKDLGKLIVGNTSGWRTEFLYEHLWPSSDAYYIPSTEGVVTEDHKYMKYFLNRDFENIMFEELYDREKDHYEVTNRIADPNYAPQLMALKEKLAILREEVK